MARLVERVSWLLIIGSVLGGSILVGVYLAGGLVLR
jgi:hypothetical protein